MVNTAQDWPVARTYAGRDLARISLPLGGIGTGTVGFGGRGQFRDWELENRPSKGLTSPLTFFACRVRGATVPAQARILEGAGRLKESVPYYRRAIKGWEHDPAWVESTGQLRKKLADKMPGRLSRSRIASMNPFIGSQAVSCAMMLMIAGGLAKAIRG